MTAYYSADDNGSAGREGPWHSSVVAPRAPGSFVRTLEAISGALSAGMIIVGLGLLIGQLFPNSFAPGTGLGAASGPGWARVILHILVGAAGELVRLARRWSQPLVRGLLAGGVIFAVIVVCWVVWWQ